MFTLYISFEKTRGARGNFPPTRAVVRVHWSRRNFIRRHDEFVTVWRHLIRRHDDFVWRVGQQITDYRGPGWYHNLVEGGSHIAKSSWDVPQKEVYPKVFNNPEHQCQHPDSSCTGSGLYPCIFLTRRIRQSKIDCPIDSYREETANGLQSMGDTGGCQNLIEEWHVIKSSRNGGAWT